MKVLLDMKLMKRVDEKLLSCEEEHATGDCFKEKNMNFCGQSKNFPCYTIMTKPHSTVLDKDWLAWKKESNRNK